jgi:hypothetical protein
MLVPTRVIKITATASSEAPLDFGEADLTQFYPLDRPRAQVLPLTHDRLNSVAFYLRNEQSSPQKLVAEIYELERIWDRQPGLLPIL